MYLFALLLLPAPSWAGHWVVQMNGAGTMALWNGMIVTCTIKDSVVTNDANLGPYAPLLASANSSARNSSASLSMGGNNNTYLGSPSFIITTKLVWTQDYPQDTSSPPPTVDILVTGYADCRQYLVNPTGVVATAVDSFPDSPIFQVPPMYGQTTTGNHLMHLTVPAGQSFVMVPGGPMMVPGGPMMVPGGPMMVPGGPMMVPGGLVTLGAGISFATAQGATSPGTYISYNVQVPNFGALTATYINKDLPTNTIYQALPTPAVVYGGSVRSTSDELLLNAAYPNSALGTTYTWYGQGGAGTASPISSPTWNVVVPPTPGTATFQCLIQPPGGAAAITKSLTVEVGIRTDDTILVGWIDRNGVPINPANVDAAILADLPLDGGTLTNVAGTARLAALADNNDCLDYLTCTMPYTQADKDYILDWMFHFANNPDPTPVLTGLQTPDVTDPSGRSTTPDLTTYAGYMNFPKLADYISDFHRFKLLNHFQVKYRVNPSNPSQFNGAPTVLQSGAFIGATVNPTGVPPDFGPLLNALASLPAPLNQPFLAAAYLNHSLLDPQAGPANGIIGPVPATNHISQINDGSPEIPGIRAFNTLTALDVQTPLYWQNIGSKITFKCGASGATLPPTTENYPTYNMYVNGALVFVRPQAALPNGHFYPSPYPFGTDISYGLPPRGPGDIPLIPGIPSFPSMNGGRNGIATTPPDDTSVAIPPYTTP